MPGIGPRSQASDGGDMWSSSAHDRAALLAHELLHVVEPARGLARRAARLPTPEGLEPRPGAGGGPRPAVDVEDAGLDPLQERVDLVGLAAEEPGGQTVLRAVGERYRFVERGHRSQADERHRSEERRVGKECRTRWSPQQEKKKRKDKKRRM